MPRTRGVVLTILTILALVLPAAMALPAPLAEAARPPVHHTAPPAAPSASAALALNPVSAEAGDSVQVTGSGFAALTTVSLSLPVYVNGVLQDVGTAVATDAQGAFTIDLLLPAGTEPGSYRVSASDAQHDSAWAHLVVLPAVTVPYGSSQIASTFIAPGQEFAVRGVGYPAGSSVQITAIFPLNGGGSAELTQTARADATGRFELYLRVPTSAAQGQVQLQAQTGTTTVTADLNVVPLGVLVAGTSAPPLQVSAGGAFYVEGSGFGAGENVQLTAAFPLFNGSSVTVSKEISTDTQGAFNATLLTVPPGVKQAEVTVTAVGLTSGRQATLTAAVSYHPSITLSATKVQPGGSITITGSGFAPGAQIALTLSNVNGTQTTTITSTAGADANGNFTAAMVVPSNLTPGTYTLSAKGSLTGAAASSTVTLAPAAAISVQPATALPGQKVSVTGQGFTAYAAVQVKMTVSVYGGGSQTVAQTVGADAAGRFTAQLTLPGKAEAGTATVTAAGSNAQASTQIQVEAITPAISVTASTVLPGQTIAVTGSGFPAYDTVKVSVAVRLSDGSTRTLSTTAHAGAKGGFVARITVPSDVVPGTYTIAALSALSGRASTTQLTVSIHPQLSVQPTSVQPGAGVTVSGSGFGAGALITVSAAFPLYGGGSKTVSTSVRSTGTGTITAPLLVPSQAAAGPVSVTATGPNGHATSSFQVGNLTANVTVTPSLIIPGASVTIAGSGYLPNGKVDIALVVTGLNGTQRTLTATATTNGAGQFSTTLQIPADVSGGTYTVTARGELSGRAPTAKIVVGKPAPALAGTPGTVAPGARVSVSGSGFAANAAVKISLQGQTLATATTSGTGSFSTMVTVPANTASGTYALTATSSTGRSARFSLAVNRPISTHLYFASIYTGTGYQQQIDILNPTEIQSRVTITYLRTNGSTLVRTVTVPAHTRATENANADLGVHVSASAVVAADVPVIAERVSLHGSDATVVPAVVAPATSWYFADGNTSGKYREYIAIENPNNQPARVTVHLLPTHHRPLDVTRMVGANARTTVKVNSYVRDAVGAIVTSGSPVVANRTVFIDRGTASKIGVTAPALRWYFAAGPSNGAAHHWIGVINPSAGRSYVSLRAYAPDGTQVGAVQGWIKGFGRAGYLMNRIAKRTDVAVVLTASRPIVAEQMTYVGRAHSASTDAFGVTAPGTGWGFAAADTTGGKTDSLALFNPSSASITVTVRYMTATGKVTQQTYTVGSFAHREIAVDSEVPNAQLGIVASSSQPFVALNRQTLNGGQGALVSVGSAVQQ